MTVNTPLAYVYSIAAQASTVAAKNFVTLFNPAGSGAVLTVGALFFSSGAINASSVLSPMRGYRISTASGGTLVDPADVGKFNTSRPTQVGELRIDNPTVTLGTALFNSPPVLTVGTGGSNVHDVTPPAGTAFVLLPGEGIVARTESGDVDLTWNISIAWGERR